MPSASYRMTDNGGKTRFRYLRAVRSDLSAVRGDDVERPVGHVDGDVVGGEVRAEPEVEPDVAASSGGSGAGCVGVQCWKWSRM